MILRRRHKFKDQVIETPASFTILASSYSGSYAQDSLSPDFYNGAGSKVAGQLKPTNSSDFVLEGKKKSRDQEVTVNNGIGTIYLRLTDDSRAWFVAFANTTNTIAIGVANNIRADENRTALDNNTSIDISGVSQITAGIEGFDIYVKLDGVEYKRFRTKYHFKRPGAVAVKMHPLNGVSSMIANYVSRKTLYSDTDAGIIDTQDFWMKSGATTGTVAIGSNQVTVAALNGLAAGDWCIMESDFATIYNGRIQGNRGTIGPGETHPLKHYPDVATMQADRTQINDLRAWVEDSGATYKNSVAENTWKKISNPVLVGGEYIPEFYYDGEAVPMALRFKILSISGNVLTINKTSASNTTNAKIFFDNNFLLSKLLMNPASDYFLNDYPETTAKDMSSVKETGIKIRMPAGKYAIGEQVYFSCPDITWYGAGQVEDGDVNTVLFSPKGAYAFNVQGNQNHNSIAENFSCEGNAGLQGYGGSWEPWHPDAHLNYASQTSGIGFPYGWINLTSDGIIMRNMSCKNIWYTFGGSTFNCSNLYRYRLKITIDDPFMMYIQWLFQDADAINGIFEECVTDSDYITKSFEVFKCTGGQFINCHARNGLWSLNSSTGWLLDGCSQTIEANTRPAFMDPLTDLVNIAVNAGPAVSGGQIIDHVMLHTGYVDAENNIMGGISIPISDMNANISILGGSYTAPNYQTGAALGPQGILSLAPDLYVDGFTVVGDQVSDISFYKSNIAMVGGTLKNSVANNIYVGASVILGTGADANTGTITVS